MDSFIADEFVANLVQEGHSEDAIKTILAGMDQSELMDTPEIITEERKVSRDAAQAFHQGKKYTNNKNNTVVRIEDGHPHLYLHGNLIAKKDDTHTHVWQHGWNTRTTNDRLSALNWGMTFGSKGIWDYGNQKTHKDFGSRSIVSVPHDNQRHREFTHEGDAGHTHLRNFRLKPKAFDLNKPQIQKSFFDESQTMEINDLLIDFDKENRHILSEAVTPGVRGMIKTIKNADHKEMLLKQIGEILVEENDPRAKYVKIRAIIGNPWRAIQR